jgi:hypothetical protein
MGTNFVLSKIKIYALSSCGVWNSSTPKYKVSFVSSLFFSVSLNVLVSFVESSLKAH